MPDRLDLPMVTNGAMVLVILVLLGLAVGLWLDRHPLHECPYRCGFAVRDADTLLAHQRHAHEGARDQDLCVCGHIRHLHISGYRQCFDVVSAYPASSCDCRSFERASRRAAA